MQSKNNQNTIKTSSQEMYLIYGAPYNMKVIFDQLTLFACPPSKPHFIIQLNASFDFHEIFNWNFHKLYISCIYLFQLKTLNSGNHCGL